MTNAEIFLKDVLVAWAHWLVAVDQLKLQIKEWTAKLNAEIEDTNMVLRPAQSVETVFAQVHVIQANVTNVYLSNRS